MKIKILVYLRQEIDPLVIFNDFLCVLILNNIFVGKLSSKDSILFKYVINKLRNELI